MHVVVLGGAGFLGSHLVDSLLQRGNEVTVIDNMSSGQMKNLESAQENRSFRFIKSDICDEDHWGVLHTVPTMIFNLASPASPTHYQRDPIGTLDAGSIGIRNILAYAQTAGSKVVHTSTSEVYGDPEVHPQSEEYVGHVNPIGPRSCYDESKRFAEALLMNSARIGVASVSIARIFNTYGPRSSPQDGRVISNFVFQALKGEPLTIYGTGEQTRSFCFVRDLVNGLLALADSNIDVPVNLGNPHEVTIGEVASRIIQLAGSSSKVEYHPLPGDDPRRRRPDISRAERLLNWRPTVELNEGLIQTIEWFRSST